MNNGLPEGWSSIPLEDLVSARKGKKPRAEKDSASKGFIPYLNIQAIEKGEVSSYAEAASSRLGTADDVLVVWDGARSGWPGLGREGAIGSTIMALQPKAGDRTYLYRWLQTQFEHVNSNTRGTGIPHVDPEVFWKLEVPFAPLNEQRRIVTKLEKLLGKVDTCQQRLAKIPVLLKRFRQSVLAAACSGRLTADWREENENIENADAQMNAALAIVAAEFDNACKVAKRDKLRKPVRPTCLDDYEVAWEDAADIPDSWIVVPLGKVCRKITDGTHDTPKPADIGVRYITAKHIRERRIDFDNSLFLSQEDHDEIFARCNPQRDDVLIVNIGAGTATPAMVRVDFEFSLKNVALLKPVHNLLLGEYLEFYQLLMKPRIFGEVSRGGAQPFMGLDLMKTIPFSLPPLTEQQEIVRRVESLFALADHIEARYAKAKAHVEKLTPSILAKAFRGELVPQGPNDEPATVFLERIRNAKGDWKRSSMRPLP